MEMPVFSPFCAIVRTGTPRGRMPAAHAAVPDALASAATWQREPAQPKINPAAPS
jgi:hypothetical protein